LVACPTVRRFAEQAAILAISRARLREGSRILTSKAIIATTTRTSIKVKAGFVRREDR
jgi:hypothetical protein